MARAQPIRSRRRTAGQPRRAHLRNRAELSTTALRLRATPGLWPRPSAPHHRLSDPVDHHDVLLLHPAWHRGHRLFSTRKQQEKRRRFLRRPKRLCDGQEVVDHRRCHRRGGRCDLRRTDDLWCRNRIIRPNALLRVLGRAVSVIAAFVAHDTRAQRGRNPTSCRSSGSRRVHNACVRQSFDISNHAAVPVSRDHRVVVPRLWLNESTARAGARRLRQLCHLQPAVDSRLANVVLRLAALDSPVVAPLGQTLAASFVDSVVGLGRRYCSRCLCRAAQHTGRSVHCPGPTRCLINVL